MHFTPASGILLNMAQILFGISTHLSHRLAKTAHEIQDQGARV